jgi:hypothetical protein
VYKKEYYFQAWLGNIYVLVILAPCLARTAEGWYEPSPNRFELGHFFFIFFGCFFSPEEKGFTPTWSIIWLSQCHPAALAQPSAPIAWVALACLCLGQVLTICI